MCTSMCNCTDSLFLPSCMPLYGHTQMEPDVMCVRVPIVICMRAPIVICLHVPIVICVCVCAHCNMRACANCDMRACAALCDMHVCAHCVRASIVCVSIMCACKPQCVGFKSQKKHNN